MNSSSTARREDLHKKESGSQESPTGRFDRLTLSEWSASSLASTFQLSALEASLASPSSAIYAAAVELQSDPARRCAYLRDAIIEPAFWSRGPGPGGSPPSRCWRLSPLLHQPTIGRKEKSSLADRISIRDASLPCSSDRVLDLVLREDRLGLPGRWRILNMHNSLLQPEVRSTP